jgi:ribosome-associated heat shock protein Hsp15
VDAGEPIAATAAVRIDKWLWAARLFKTRSLAAAACRGGHVTLGGNPVKPSREVRAGEVIVVKGGEVTRTVKVTGASEKRVGPKLVGQLMEDLTPAAEYLRALQRKDGPQIFQRPKGAGRPTKKERRAMEKLQGEP